MSRFSIFLISLFFLHSQDFSMEYIYPIELSHSYIGFDVGYMGIGNVKGRFTKFNGTLYYNPKSLEKTSVSLNIETASLRSENDWRDKDLKSAGWFGVDSFPSINFTSTSVQKNKNGFLINGDLTIRANTKTVTIKMKRPSDVMEDAREDMMVVFAGSLSINRKDFKVLGSRWGDIVADEVKIELNILGKRVREHNMKLRIRNPKNIAGQIYKEIEANGMSAGLKTYDKLSEKKKWILTTVGYIYITSGEYDKAIKVLNHNIKNFPNDANNYDSLAEAYATKGDFKKAKEFYKKAFAADKTNLNAKEILRHL